MSEPMQLKDYQARWNEKPVLRKVYRDLYRRIEEYCVDGNVLEVGGGIGNFKLGQRDIIRTDIQLSKRVDVVSDAHYLPFQNSSFNNIVLIDVLHHLECPLEFLYDAKRVLRRGGRIIMIEPGITPVSWVFYKLFHPEPIKMDWYPEKICHKNPMKDPYDSNQAIPTLLFGDRYQYYYGSKNGLEVISSRWLSIFTYPLSGGFKKWSLVSSKWVGKLLAFEDRLLNLLGSLMAFRLLVVLERPTKIDKNQ